MKKYQNQSTEAKRKTTKSDTGFFKKPSLKKRRISIAKPTNKNSKGAKKQYKIRAILALSIAPMSQSVATGRIGHCQLDDAVDALAGFGQQSVEGLRLKKKRKNRERGGLLVTSVTARFCNCLGGWVVGEGGSG